MSKTRPLPRDTNERINRYFGSCLNLGLILDKFQPFGRVSRTLNPAGWDHSLEVQEKRQGEWQSKPKAAGEARGYWLAGPIPDKVKIVGHHLEPGKRIDTMVLEAFQKRWQLTTSGCRHLDAWTESRMIVGLGATHTFETALTLHPLYGFPYIPGTAVKGITRAAAFYDLAEKLGIPAVDNETYAEREKKNRETPLALLQRLLEQEEKEWPETLQVLRADELVDQQRLGAFEQSRPVVEAFRTIFGRPGAAGCALFFDGIPRGVPELGTDVMTPHFPKYYSEGEPPQDDQSPNPVTFLVVNPGSAFRFAVGKRRELTDELLDQAVQWLQEGLTTLGVGSKTAAGYGFFTDRRPNSASVQEGREEREFWNYYPANRPSKRRMPPPTRQSSDRTQSFADEFMRRLIEKQDE